MTRSEILDLAKEYTTNDRNVDYDEPEDNFSDIADMFSIYLHRLDRSDGLLPHDVAIFCAIIKMCRIKQSPSKTDHWADGAGYFACGGEIATRPVEVDLSGHKIVAYDENEAWDGNLKESAVVVEGSSFPKDKRLIQQEDGSFRVGE